MNAADAGRQMALTVIGALQDGTIDRAEYDELVTRAAHTETTRTPGQSTQEWLTERRMALAFTTTIQAHGPREVGQQA